MHSSAIVIALLALTSVFVVYNIPQKSGFRPESEELKSLFEQWKVQYSKEYESADEEALRFKIFQDNLAIINAHNADKTQTFTMGINKFTDLTNKEFAARFNGYKAEEKTESNVKILDTSSNPTSINWVEQGAVTAVKNQGQCGSCWSFSTTGSTEGLNVISGGSLTAFSEQQLMDCSWLYGNRGCDGGIMDSGFKYLVAKGSESEDDYPYTAQSSLLCKYASNKVRFQISGFNDVQTNSVDQLEAAVAKQPVSIAVEADQAAWQNYNSGVVTKNCGQQLDHGVLVAGYDTDGSTDYWLVKNSWGADWGEKGYIRILRSSANICGVLSSPSYPTK